MAPAFLHTSRDVKPRAVVTATRDSAWVTQASWRQVPHGSAAGTPKGTKFAPQHRDFAAGNVEVIK